VTKDVASTLVRPATYTDTIVGAAANFVPYGAWGGAAGGSLVSLTDTRDVAAASAVILLEGAERHASKIYDVSGPSAVTMYDVARFNSDGLGTSGEDHDRTESEQRAVLESVGVPALLVDVLLGLDNLGVGP
jgi:NAD(P)H dehydrogenase (quinone)